MGHKISLSLVHGSVGELRLSYMDTAELLASATRAFGQGIFNTLVQRC